MQTTYSDFEIKVDESFGDPYITLVIYAHQNGKRAFFMLLFRYFTRFLESHFPQEADYINGIRRSLGGYGLKEEQVVAVLQEEGFDFEKYMMAYLESLGNQVEEEIERQNRLLSQPDTQAKISKSLEKLDSLKPVNPIKSSVFLDELEKVILNHLISTYPEFTEGEPEDIKKLQSILIHAIPNLGTKLMNLIYEIRDRQ